MDLQADAVAKRVHVAVGRARLRRDRRMTVALEVLGGHALVIGRRRVDLERRHHLQVDLAHLVVQRLRLVGRVTQTPGTREVVEVAAARLRREDVEHDRLPEPQRLIGAAARVRDAGVAALREDRASLGVDDALLGELEVDARLDRADGHGLAGAIHQDVALGALLAEEVVDVADDGHGLEGHRADPRDFVGVFRHSRLADQIGRKRDRGPELRAVELRDEFGRETRVLQPGQRQAPAHAQMLQHVAEQPSLRARGVARSLFLGRCNRELRLVQIEHAQARLGGFFTLHAAHEQRAFASARFDQDAALANTGAIGHVVHGRVVCTRAEHDEAVKVLLFEQGVDLGFHARARFLWLRFESDHVSTNDKGRKAPLG